MQRVRTAMRRALRIAVCMSMAVGEADVRDIAHARGARLPARREGRGCQGAPRACGWLMRRTDARRGSPSNGVRSARTSGRAPDSRRGEKRRRDDPTSHLVVRGRHRRRHRPRGDGRGAGVRPGPHRRRPPAGGYSAYPEYADVDCAAHTFNGADYTGSIAKIEATDPSTVVFTLCTPDPAFLSKISFAPFAINDADYLIAHAPDQSIVDNPNGTGPFKLEEWRRGSEVILTANPDYWGDAPKNERSIMRWSSEPGQKLIELQSGTVDGVDNPSVDDLEGIAADPDLTVIPREGFNVFFLGMNDTYEPFNNEKVRQAIALGIDKQRIVDQFYGEGSSVADYFTPCFIPHACGGDPFPAFDPEAAQGAAGRGPRRARPRLLPRGAPLACASSTAPTCPSRSRSRWTSRTSSRRTWASRRRSTSRNRAPSSTTTTMATCRASTCSVGMPTIQTSRTSSTSTSALAPTPSSAMASRTSTRP